ncbi:MAG: hypothetical protein SNI51_05625 [Rikenellaceae bacterium]
MKKLLNLSIALLAFAAITSCSGSKSFGKMDEGFDASALADAVGYSCTPEVLTLTNGVVATEVTIDFPADYFSDKVIVKVTPAIVFDGGEAVGSSFYYQGVKVDDNYTVVTDAGGSFTETVKFAYVDDMQLSDLQLRVELKNAKKATNSFYVVNANNGQLLTSSEDDIVESGSDEATAILRACGVVVAKGINTLQQDFCYASLMDVMANDYKAVTYDVSKANIAYAINSSKVNTSSLNNSQMEAFKEFIEAAKEDEAITQSISANGYASPDGPEKLNDKLSSARSESAKKAMDKFFSEMGLEADVAAYGEDWDGFKELVQASSIQDKNLILQVLSLYDSSVQREAEIKNLSSVYSEIKTDILPELRRAQLINNISIQGMSDEEMMAIIEAGNYSELGLEELLYLSDSVIEEKETKLEVLKFTAGKYRDSRAQNNYGIELAKSGDAEGALAAFERATKYGASDATINKNLVLANLDNYDYAEAKKYTADTEASYMLSAIEGNYSPAAANLEGYNAAVANIMNSNYSAAKSNLRGLECPKADYLRAVIASGEGQVEAGINFVKKAIAADSSLAEKAKKDINLANLFEGGLTL